MRQDREGILRPIGAEHSIRRHAVRVDDLALGRARLVLRPVVKPAVKPPDRRRGNKGAKKRQRLGKRVRKQKADAAKALRSDGFSFREIAERMEIPIKVAWVW